MASQRSTNTMSEFLQRMLGDLAMAKTLPDADLQFLVGIETAILQKMREPVDALAGQSAAVPDMGAAQAESLPSGMAGGMGLETMGAGGMGAGMGGGPTTPLPGSMGMSGSGGGGVPGVMSAPQTIPPDELRRMLG